MTHTYCFKIIYINIYSYKILSKTFHQKVKGRKQRGKIFLHRHKEKHRLNMGTVGKWTDTKLQSSFHGTMRKSNLIFQVVYRIVIPNLPNAVIL